MHRWCLSTLDNTAYSSFYDKMSRVEQQNKYYEHYFIGWNMSTWPLTAMPWTQRPMNDLSTHLIRCQDHSQIVSLENFSLQPLSACLTANVCHIRETWCKPGQSTSSCCQHIITHINDTYMLCCNTLLLSMQRNLKYILPVSRELPLKSYTNYFDSSSSYMTN